MPASNPNEFGQVLFGTARAWRTKLDQEFEGAQGYKPNYVESDYLFGSADSTQSTDPDRAIARVPVSTRSPRSSVPAKSKPTSTF